MVADSRNRTTETKGNPVNISTEADPDVSVGSLEKTRKGTTEEP